MLHLYIAVLSVIIVLMVPEWVWIWSAVHVQCAVHGIFSQPFA